MGSGSAPVGGLPPEYVVFLQVQGAYRYRVFVLVVRVAGGVAVALPSRVAATCFQAHLDHHYRYSLWMVVCGF